VAGWSNQFQNQDTNDESINKKEVIFPKIDYILLPTGYALDPVLGCFTGFRVRRDDYPTVPDRRPRWIGRNAITHITR